MDRRRRWRRPGADQRTRDDRGSDRGARDASRCCGQDLPWHHQSHAPDARGAPPPVGGGCRDRPGWRRGVDRARGDRDIRCGANCRRDAAFRSADLRGSGVVGAGRPGPRGAAAPVSMSLADRDRAHIWHPYTQMQIQAPLVPVVRGEGVYLYTEDGRRILDGISSWWVNIHGHSHPRLNRALAEQAQRLEHVLFAGCTHPAAVELAERLVAAVPRGLTRVFYSDNGSTAVEVAVKMALQYWLNKAQPQRTVLVGLEHAYHGDTVGAMSVSADSLFTKPFAPLLFEAV